MARIDDVMQLFELWLFIGNSFLHAAVNFHHATMMKKLNEMENFNTNLSPNKASV